VKVLEPPSIKIESEFHTKDLFTWVDGVPMSYQEINRVEKYKSNSVSKSRCMVFNKDLQKNSVKNTIARPKTLLLNKAKLKLDDNKPTKVKDKSIPNTAKPISKSYHSLCYDKSENKQEI
jgi:hypothetical protein